MFLWFQNKQGQTVHRTELMDKSEKKFTYRKTGRQKSNKKVCIMTHEISFNLQRRHLTKRTFLIKIFCEKLYVWGISRTINKAIIYPWLTDGPKMVTFNLTNIYCMYKKSWPISYSKLLKDFFDRQYIFFRCMDWRI